MATKVKLHPAGGWIVTIRNRGLRCSGVVVPDSKGRPRGGIQAYRWSSAKKTSVCERAVYRAAASYERRRRRRRAHR